MMKLNEIGFFSAEKCYRTLYIQVPCTVTSSGGHIGANYKTSHKVVPIFSDFQQSAATYSHLVSIIYIMNNLYCSCLVRYRSLKPPLCYADTPKPTLLQQNFQFGSPQRQNAFDPPLLG